MRFISRQYKITLVDNQAPLTTLEAENDVPFDLKSERDPTEFGPSLL